ncbi:hypothetical protein ACROAE_06930 [Shewanella sp. MF05960]|uniref:hypothetical protein n=1 Tax=Shewanella sp. MF05960 TaxID=3434874 RepID=UPI003D797F57
MHPILKQDLPDFAKQTLKHILKQKGEVIYSSHETLKEGDIYLLGLNPGGDGQENPDTASSYSIKSHLDRMLKRTENSFIDERWENKVAHYEAGKAPLQMRVIDLLKGIGVNDPRTVCASNIIFKTSRDSSDLCYGLAGLCWPVHEAILNLVKPKLILTFGISSISAYAFLKELFHIDETELTIDADHGDWKCKGFKCEINGKSTFIVAVPHLSYYSPKNKTEVFSWIKENAGL